ncbi:MAG: hypothetical protein CMK07_01495 [Ponticaulis sp.]|nr:hypothetical protein [Ponticaulis sp.]
MKLGRLGFTSRSSERTDEDAQPPSDEGAFGWLWRKFPIGELAAEADRPTAQTVVVLCLTQALLGFIITGFDFLLVGKPVFSHGLALGASIFIFCLPFVMTKTGRIRLVAWGLILSVSVTAFLICLGAYGIQSASAPILLLPIFWAWLTLSSRGAILVSCLTLVEMIILSWLSHTGATPITDAVTIPSNRSLVLILVMISAAISGYAAWYNSRAYQQRLIRARDEAMQANRAKSEFIASIAHEVRTPMTGLMGMLELLSKEPLLNEQAEMATTAKSSAGNLLNLINDLLDLSKIEVGELRLLPEPVNICSIFHETVRGFQQFASEKGLVLEAECEQEALWLLIDPVRFRQILSNFLSNAVKFTDEGHIKAVLTDEELNNGMVRLQLSVSDTGSGIPKQDQRRIFGRFTQVERHRKAHHQGTGLGLAIVADLANLQGGQVWLESEEDKGSVFHFQASFKRTSALEPTAASVAAEPYQDVTILIADDSVGNQRVLSRVLQGLGYKTVSVANGSDAIVSIARQSVDLVLMDFNMPVKDGPTALRDIRSLPDSRKSQTPVIGLSADASESDMKRWNEAGVDGFVSKPVDFATLDLTIRRVLGVQRQNTASEKVRTGS